MTRFASFVSLVLLLALPLAPVASDALAELPLDQVQHSASLTRGEVQDRLLARYEEAIARIRERLPEMGPERTQRWNDVVDKLEDELAEIDTLSDDSLEEYRAWLRLTPDDFPLPPLVPRLAERLGPDRLQPKNHAGCLEGPGVLDEVLCWQAHAAGEVFCETTPAPFNLYFCEQAYEVELNCLQIKLENDLHEDCARRTFRNHVESELDDLGSGLGSIGSDITSLESSVDSVASELDDVSSDVDTILDEVTCRPVAELLRGHGCDGADDNCDQLVDDCSEDAFGPELTIDAAVATKCYRTAEGASAAVAQAVHALDDCQESTISAPTLAGQGCNKQASVTATDACGNSTTASVEVKVDGLGPAMAIDPAIEGGCFSTVAAGELAVLGAASIADNCDAPEQLQVDLHSSVTDCSLRVRIGAEDLCGNRSETAATVRVDTALPFVNIDRGLVAPRDTACYASVDAAEAAVQSALVVNDNCTPAELVTSAISSSGDPCNLLVRADATDECGNTAADSVVVRVDPQVPVVACSVTTPRLEPVNNEMVAIGLAYSVTDNCDGDPEVRIFVTSDEPTSSQPVAGGPDAAPDATIRQDLDGAVEDVLLRSQAVSSGDGRVYRIRVQATDSCGNVGFSDCFVEVRRQPNSPAVDNGQYYDATAFN